MCIILYLSLVAILVRPVNVKAQAMYSDAYMLKQIINLVAV